MRRTAFTLVELLVVFAVLGLLAAVLLPAVVAAREAARLSQCLSNLHQFSVHLNQYSDGHGVMPSLVGCYDQPELQCPEHISLTSPERIDSYYQRGQFQSRVAIQERIGLASTEIAIVQDAKPIHSQTRNILFLDGHAETNSLLDVRFQN